MTELERMTELVKKAKAKVAEEFNIETQSFLREGKKTVHTRSMYEIEAEFLLENGVILPSATMDEKIKEAARLRYNNGRSLQEIGEIMGYSTRQIGRYLKRFEEECENGGMDL